LPPANIPSGSPLDPNLNQTAPVSQEIPQ